MTSPPRALGFWTAVSLVMGSMIGSGVFLLPSALAPYGGLAIAGWLISAGGAVLLALVFSRLARVDPSPGGPYAYTRHAFGDLPGFLVAWGYWISVWTANAALAIACVGYLDPFIPALVRRPLAAAALAILLVWLFTYVNIRGVRTAGRVQVVTTVLKIAPLVVLALVGLVRFAPAHFAVPAPVSASLGHSLFAVTTLTMFALVGLEAATVPAEAVRDPTRTIPRATMVGTLLTAAIYIASTAGVMSLVPPATLAASTAPFADAARVLVGDRAAAVIALGAAISCVGALNGWTLIVGQVPLAMVQDGLFPRIFGRLTPQGTPAAGMIIAAILTTGLIVMNSSRGLVDLFTFVVLLSTLAVLIPYAFSSLANLLLPRRADAARLTRAQVWVSVAAFVFSFGAIAGAGASTVFWGFLLILAGLPVYVWVVTRRSVATAPEAPSHPPQASSR